MTLGPNPEKTNIKFKTKKIEVVKWDGDAPDYDGDPRDHPQCEEIVEIDYEKDGKLKTLYRRV